MLPELDPLPGPSTAPRSRFLLTTGRQSIDQADIYPLLEAASEATEEAIINALFMATDMVGRDGNRVYALPLDRTLEVMKRHHRLYSANEMGGSDD